MRTQVAIGSLDTPIGRLWMACSEQGVCKLVFPGDGAKAIIERWLAVHQPTPRLTAANTLLERTEAEYASLLAQARFGLTRVVPTESIVSVVEAVPV